MIFAEQAEKGPVIGNFKNPFLQPAIKPLRRTAFLVVQEIKIVIAPCEALSGGRMGAERLVDDAGDNEPRYHRSIRVFDDDVVIDQFLAGENHLAGGQRRFAHHSEIPPNMGITLAVGPLHVEDSDVRTNGAYGQ